LKWKLNASARFETKWWRKMKIKFKDFGYLVSLIPTLLTIAGNVSGGYAAAGNALFSLVGLVVSDWFFRDDATQPEQRSPFVPNLVLVLHVLTHTTAIGTLVYGVYARILTGGFVWAAAISTGVNSGMSGIIIAHELIHRENKIWRRLGIWNLVLVGYSHFTIEHIKGHHKLAATLDDPATARFGETAYAFVWRTIPAQYKSALHLETVRLQKQNKAAYGLSNFVGRLALVQAALAVAIGLGLGVLPVLAFLVQAGLAVFLLELTNYVEHYGLLRNAKERVTAAHSWQSDNVSTRFMLLELSRHADHHYYAAKPFHDLVTYKESPVHPTGYLGMLPLVLVPPLWFKLTHRKLDEFQKQNVTV
jgi:alkane 1-monooxygenase